MADYAEYLSRIRSGEIYLNPFLGFMGIIVEEIGDGYARFSMPLRREFMQVNGVMQGGLLVAMADETIAHAIMSVLNPEDNIATIELKNNFLATVREGTVTSEATVFKKGRTLIVGDSIVSDDNGKIITRTTATFLICR